MAQRIKKIYIDLTSLYNRKITGLEIYGIDLYRCLLKKDVNVIPIFRNKNTIDNNKKAIILPYNNRIVVEQLVLPKFISKLDDSIVLYPVFPPGYLTYFLKRGNVKIIPTIHDSVAWNYQDTLSIKAKLYLKPLYNLALKKADTIITISEIVKNELSLMTNKKVVNLSNCISDIFDDVDNINTDILNKLNLKKDNYIISVSTIEPRKNLIYLLEVYEALLKKGFNYKLVLVGRKGWGNDKKLKSFINKMKEQVIFTDFVSNEDLITLYKNAKAFFLFSKYEGFGRPPLEALACGTSVVVSDIPVFREILGNNVLYIPLDNVDLAVRKILNYRFTKKIKNHHNFQNWCKRLYIRKVFDDLV